MIVGYARMTRPLFALKESFDPSYPHEVDVSCGRRGCTNTHLLGGSYVPTRYVVVKGLPERKEERFFIMITSLLLWSPKDLGVAEFS